MARVRIQIEYDDGQEDDSEQWSAFGTTEDRRGPSLRIERDDGVLLSLSWFKMNVWNNSPRALVASVLRVAAGHIEDEP